MPRRGLGIRERLDRRQSHQRIGIVELARRGVDGDRRQQTTEPGQGARAHERRIRLVLDQAQQRAARAGCRERARAQRGGEVLVAGRGLARPTRDRVGRPLRGLLRVTVVAGVRRAHLRGDIGPRDAHRVVVPGVDPHVRRRRHVACRARRAGRALGVVRVLRRVELRRQMALGADGVAWGPQLQRVRLVTVRAGDSLRVHPALHERAPVVDLVAHLPVVPVEIVVEERQSMGVERRLAVDVVVGDAAGAAVATRAHLDLAGRRPRRAALRTPGLGHRRPGDALALVERERETLARRERLPVALLVRPRDVAGAGAVARLARDVDLVPLRIEGAGLRVEVLPQVGRMAFGALEIPVLLHARPVQRIAGLDVLARIEMEPALAALRLRARVPGNAERLHAAARKLDQVLLQRAHPEGVLDLVVGELAVRPVRVDEELAVAAREGRRGARIGEFRVGEIAQHRFVVRDLHREVVVGAFPRRVLAGMASGTLRGTDILRRGDGDRCRRDGRRRALALRPEHGACDERRHECRRADNPGAATARAGRGQGFRIRRRTRGCGGFCRRPGCAPFPGKRSLPSSGHRRGVRRAGAAHCGRRLPDRRLACVRHSNRRPAVPVRAGSPADGRLPGAEPRIHPGRRRARIRKRIATWSCTWSAPPRMEKGAIPKLVCSQHDTPVHAHFRARRERSAAKCPACA